MKNLQLSTNNSQYLENRTRRRHIFYGRWIGSFMLLNGDIANDHEW